MFNSLRKALRMSLKNKAYSDQSNEYSPTNQNQQLPKSLILKMKHIKYLNKL